MGELFSVLKADQANPKPDSLNLLTKGHTANPFDRVCVSASRILNKFTSLVTFPFENAVDESCGVISPFFVSKSISNEMQIFNKQVLPSLNSHPINLKCKRASFNRMEGGKEIGNPIDPPLGKLNK